METLFRDWIVLLLSPEVLWRAGNQYCPVNAAASGGSRIARGVAGVRALYADKVVGGDGVERKRPLSMLRCCPTDNQAEVLVAGSIPPSLITGVVVAEPAQAALEIGRLEQIGLGGAAQSLQFIVAPHHYRGYDLSSAINTGKRPRETVYTQERAS